MTEAEWTSEGARRFGGNNLDWRFVRPNCGHICAVREWRDAGAPKSAAAFSCIGRWLGVEPGRQHPRPRPCDYAGGGLFRLNPVTVTVTAGPGAEHRLFEFAP